MPEWFGIPESTAEYIETSRLLPFFAAVENGEAKGFVALKRTSPFAVEIYVIGVLSELHRSKPTKFGVRVALA